MWCGEVWCGVVWCGVGFNPANVRMSQLHVQPYLLPNPGYLFGFQFGLHNALCSTLSSGQRAVSSGQWAVGNGQWAVGCVQWAVGCVQWAVGSGL